jgi:hypothetical protein
MKINKIKKISSICDTQIHGLFKKYLFFPGKTSDDRMENLITVVGGTFMSMCDFLQPRLVHLSLLSS